jgi:membrane-associated HD superfamily phosphohydrolase
MRCPNCNSDQDETHFYCNNCGHDLHHAENHDQPYEIMPKIDSFGLVEETVDDLKKQAHTVELETLENIQDRAAKWAKTNLYFLGLASAVLLLALSFFGYKKITDLENLIVESENKVEKLVAEATQTTEKANLEATASLEKALKLRTDIEQVDLSSIQAKLDKLSRLEAQLDKSNQKSANISEQLLKERENVEKLQRSFYTISVQLDGSQEQSKQNWNRLMQALDEKGFQLNRANIVELGVNRTEVLYYNNIAQQQAELIASLVQDSLSLPGVSSRLISMLERNPREILIKIKLP